MLLKKQGKKLFLQILKNQDKNNKTDKVYFDTYMQHYLEFCDKLRSLFIFFFTFINKYVIFVNNYINKMTPEAERFNGWAAMLGFVAAVGAYVTTGQIIPGWF